MDLADAHVRALGYLDEQPQTNFYEVFNLGTGMGNSVMEVIQIFEEATGVPINYTFGPRRSGDVEQIYASVSKAEKILGWKASKTMKEALAHTWKWQQSLMKSV
jgi:UDP-glucose 4-epimerase